MIYSEEAESGVLGSILLDSDRVIDICQRYGVDNECFCSQRNRKLYDTILRMHQENEAIDILTVSQRLKTEGNILL